MGSDKYEQEGQWRRELEDFKRDVNLVDFAKSYGYEPVRKKSTRSSKVLKHPLTNHRIVVGRSVDDDHWVYYTIGDNSERDSGTVVDFAQRREAGDLGAIRRKLRDWLGRPEPFAPSRDNIVKPSRKDRTVAVLRFESARVAATSRYLNERGLRPETLQDSRFRDTWRLDDRDNVLFVHRDSDGISGYEIKGRGFTGFAAQGSKTAWFSRPAPTDNRLVLAESAIDALSYHQLHPEPNTRYLSFGGAPNDAQLALLERAVQRMPRGSRVVAALDADKAGDDLYERIVGRLQNTTHIQLVRHSPDLARGKDWNDILQQSEREYIGSITAGERATHVRVPNLEEGRSR